jgi:pilus assembly protein CpaB
MRARSLLTLMIGLGLAGTAVWAVDRHLDRAQPTQLLAAEPQIALAQVVVVNRDLGRGDRIRPDFLKVVDWPAAAVPKDAFGSITHLLGDGSEDRRVRRPMVAGEPVLAAKISGFGGKDTLGETLDPTQRAVSIRLNDVSGVSGFILPGDRVDVLLTRQLDNRSDLVSDVILQNVVVLAIDQLTDEEREKPQLARTATVQVTPEQAQKLALAMQVGTLSLALRNIIAAEPTPATRIRVGDLVQSERPARQGPVAPSVVVRRGATATVQPLNAR